MNLATSKCWPDRRIARSRRFRSECHERHRSLSELGESLPEALAPAAKFVPFVVAGDIVHVSGQISQNSDDFVTGKLGRDLDVEASAAAARNCALSLLAPVKAACGGDPDRLIWPVKLTGFANSAPEFADRP